MMSMEKKSNKIANPRWAAAMRRGSEMPEKRVEWLIEPFLARGESTMIAGDPGSGKSSLAMQLACVLTQGRDLEGNDIPAGPQTVLILEMEDDPAATIVPYVKRNGGNPDNLIVYDTDSCDEIIALDDPDLIPYAQKNGVGVIVLDPLTEFFTAIDMNSASQTKALLGPFIRRCRRAGIAVLALHHVGKSTAGKTDISLASGSAQIAGSFRLSFLVYPPGNRVDEPFRWVMQAKSNLPGSTFWGPMAWGRAWGDDGEHMLWYGRCTADIDAVKAGTAGVPRRMRTATPEEREAREASDDRYAQILLDLDAANNPVSGLQQMAIQAQARAQGGEKK